MIRLRRLLPLTAIAIGVFAGVGIATFDYAEGTSYFSTDPAACANCHIMNSQYDSWQKSSHHTVATCVECHLPASFLGKYLAKAENGWNHSKAFTLQDFPEPIAMTDKNAAILQANCLRCHQALTDSLAAAHAAGVPLCIHCHSDVGHGPRTGLGAPWSAREAEVESE